MPTLSQRRPMPSSKRNQAVLLPAQAAALPAPPVPARPQMADIARLAGVSVSAVSLALRGSPMIGEQTRERIVALARSLNYRVNVGAQNLRTKRNRTVAVVVPYSANDRHHLFEPFYLALIGSIADALINQGLQMLLARADQDSGDLAALYESGQAAGLILTGAQRPHAQCNQLALNKVPLVVWGPPMAQQLYCSVGSDNLLGARLVVDHLLGQGARCIAFLGDHQLPEGRQRYAGYSQALQAHGLAADPALQFTPAEPAAAMSARLAELLARFPQLDGVFASGDVIAMNAALALRQLGRQVPDDVLLAGFDDIALAAYFQPSLTTVRQPMTEVGVAIVAALSSQLAGEAVAAVQLPTELIVRQSSVRAARRQPAQP